jgi:hypothetical protein
VWNGCARKTGGLIQCLVSSRLTRPVQVRANSKIYAFKVALGTLLASCVRSDARRRQSRSLLSNGSDFDIAHRQKIIDAQLCTVSRLLSVAYATHANKKAPGRESYNVRRIGISAQRKAPRRGGALPKAFCFAVLASRRWRDRGALWSGLFIRRINPQRFESYAASLHCAFTSFAALLR